MFVRGNGKENVLPEVSASISEGTRPTYGPESTQLARSAQADLTSHASQGRKLVIVVAFYNYVKLRQRKPP